MTFWSDISKNYAEILTESVNVGVSDLVLTELQNKFDAEAEEVRLLSSTDLNRGINDNFVALNQEESSIIFDDSDANDYNSRFISVDALDASDTAEDIAFFRIVDTKNDNAIIFPKSINSNLPGVSANKFRQFILTSLSEPTQERVQILENSLNFSLNFFGTKPQILQISGFLKNTIMNPWNMNMIFLWENLMRGSVLAEKGYLFQMYSGKVLYSGYPIAFQRNKVAGQDFIVTFNTSIVVTKKTLSKKYTWIQQDEQTQEEYNASTKLGFINDINAESDSIAKAKELSGVA